MGDGGVDLGLLAGQLVKRVGCIIPKGGFVGIVLDFFSRGTTYHSNCAPQKGGAEYGCHGTLNAVLHGVDFPFMR
jgi:hypothetical protein